MKNEKICKKKEKDVAFIAQNSVCPSIPKNPVSG